MTQILVIVGTVAELIKMVPVIEKLKKKKLDFKIICLGQQDCIQLLHEFNITNYKMLTQPKVNRGIFENRILKAVGWGVKLFFKLKKVIKKEKPRIILVHGDTLSTVAGTLAGKISFHPIIVGHVEAGIRSGNIEEPFPEEIARRITDTFADYLFAPTPRAVHNLKNNFFTRNKKIILTGNTNIDVIKKNLPIALRQSKMKVKGNYVFAQMHRYENLASRERVQKFINLINKQKMKVILMIPHNSRIALKKYGFEKPFNSNVRIVDNLPYYDFLSVFSRAKMIITDGGGQTEEACYLGIPTIVFRNATERQEAEETGIAHKYYENKPFKKLKRGNTVFGDGKASERIVKQIISLLN